jgi:hypothetical protein
MSNLLTVEEQIKNLVGCTENTQIATARLIRVIHKEELWKQSKAKSFNEYIKTLLELTSRIGWKAERTLRNYIKLWAVYVEQLGIDEEAVVENVSHYGLLLPVANTNAKLELDDHENEEGTKLGRHDFASLTETVAKLANGIELSEPEAKQFKLIVGYEPHTDSWDTEDTKEVVDAIKGVKAEDVLPFGRIWAVSTFDEEIYTVHAVSVLVDGEVSGAFSKLSYQPVLNKAELKKFIGKDQTVDLETVDLEEEDD